MTYETPLRKNSVVKEREERGQKEVEREETEKLFKG